MNLTLRELRVFRAVYELRSFSTASGAMHMTQSAVSKVCQEMEAKVGGVLFERSSRKMVPTFLAGHLYGYTCEILGTMDAAERSLQSLLDLEVGELRIAASPMMMHGLMTGPVRDFHARHPGVRIGLHELSTDATVEHVISGKVDFGVVSIRQKHAKLTIEPLYEERMQLVCAGDHVLAAQPELTWEQAAAHPHISLHRSFSVRSTVDGIYARKGLEVASVIEAGSVLSVLALVQAGLGVAVLPGYIERFATDLGLACRALPAADFSHPIALIQRWNARPSMAAGLMISMLKASLAGRAAEVAAL